MGRIDRRLKTELGSLPSPEPRPAHVDETAALCLKAYRARRRMSRLSVTGLIAGQLRFVAAPIWAAQAAAVLCMCLVLGLAMRSEDFAADAPALLGMFSVFVAMSALPFYGRSRKYKMRELESSTRLSSRRLLRSRRRRMPYGAEPDRGPGGRGERSTGARRAALSARLHGNAADT